MDKFDKELLDIMTKEIDAEIIKEIEATATEPTSPLLYSVSTKSGITAPTLKINTNTGNYTTTFNTTAAAASTVYPPYYGATTIPAHSTMSVGSASYTVPTFSTPSASTSVGKITIYDSNNSPIAEINCEDGTVMVHKFGKDVEAAQRFWDTMAFRGKSMRAEIELLKNQLAEAKDTLSKISAEIKPSDTNDKAQNIKNLCNTTLANL